MRQATLIFDLIGRRAYSHTSRPILWFMPEGRVCPDLLALHNLGAAHTARGRIIRAFFLLLQAWPKR